MAWKANIVLVGLGRVYKDQLTTPISCKFLWPRDTRDFKFDLRSGDDNPSRLEGAFPQLDRQKLKV